MPSRTLSVADVEITAILDVDTSIPLAAMFDGSGDPAPEGIAASYPDEFTDDAWHFPGPLLRGPDTHAGDPDRRGAGPADSAFGRWLGVAGALPDELGAIGMGPGDVDDVILTHVHSDHTDGPRRRRRTGGCRGSRTLATTSTAPTSTGCGRSPTKTMSASSPR
jgi:hypothetical protein